MNNIFVPYEIAIQLKEKGFKQSGCFAEYVQWDGSRPWLNIYQDWSPEDSEQHTKECEAPTYQQVINWLDEKGIVIEIQVDRTAEPKYCFEVFKYEHFGNWKKHTPQEWFLYRTRTEATNVAINEALKLL